MALYYYQALSKEGKRISGTIDAATTAQAREQLTRQGIYPTAVALADALTQVPWYRRWFSRGVSVKEKILFTRQLAVLLRSGVPLLQAVDLLTEHFEGKLRTMLVSVRDDLKEGTSFADALRKYPKVFDNIYVQLVRAGEASGKLEFILDRLVTFLERRAMISRKVRAALRMPLIQLGIAGVIVMGLMTFVVPRMVENFASEGKSLPTPTRILMAISYIFSHYYLIVIALIVGLYAAFRYWKSTARGAYVYDQIKLKIPIVKYFTRMNAVVQFSQTLGVLLEGGVNLAEALDIVVNIVDNKVLAQTLQAAREKIIKQGNISQYLRQTNIFPAIAIYLINTGEQSGQLDTMLLTVARNYEDELSDYADSLSARLGPILLVAMGIIVGFIVMAIALPIIQQSSEFEF